MLHSIAFASSDAMKNDFLQTTSHDFAQAHVISAYSLIALSRGALPLMPPATKGGGSILSLSYLGANRVSEKMSQQAGK